MKARRERQESQRRALGIARIVEYEFTEWAGILAGSQRERKWWPAGLFELSKWERSELQVLAAELSRGQWEYVRAALVIPAALASMRDARGDQDFEKVMMTPRSSDTSSAAGLQEMLNRACRALLEYSRSVAPAETDMNVAPTGFVTLSPGAGKVGEAYLYEFGANGVPAPEYVLAGGNLPPGLVLATSGKLEGIPTTAGEYKFKLRATNVAGSYTTPHLAITVF